MSEDLNSFLFHLEENMRALNQQIQSLHVEIELLKKKTAELEQRPPMQIDNIEYKFDQLKVETLTGTLNIGLNPTDAETIAELSVNNENPLSPYMFQERELFVQQLTSDAIAYLEGEKGNLIQQASQMSQAPFDEQIAHFLIEELHQQLPARVGMYLDQTPIYDRTVDRLPVVVERIRKKLEHDIDKAVLNFINQKKSDEN